MKLFRSHSTMNSLVQMRSQQEREKKRTAERSYDKNLDDLTKVCDWKGANSYQVNLGDEDFKEKFDDQIVQLNLRQTVKEMKDQSIDKEAALTKKRFSVGVKSLIKSNN